MAERWNGRFLLVASAVDGYAERTALMQGELLAGFARVLDAAAWEAGLARDSWRIRRSSGSELAVLPGTENEAEVVGRFVEKLATALTERNRTAAEAARVRLRVAVHSGQTIEGPHGFSGSGPVTAERLRDCPELVAALAAAPAADLAVIVADPVYQDTVAGQLTPLEPGDLREVKVRGSHAWFWLPGHALPEPPPAGPGPAGAGQERPKPPAGGGPSVSIVGNTINSTYFAVGDIHGAQG
ncbi:hypothetical protein [Actinocorallia longicatena]|uniref:Guanylate cyclase domain-containing protein n=1 Tax=Actinocorallia longicatena TaxID=111803 RepID=A0ABP6QIL8_9ACTN